MKKFLLVLGIILVILIIAAIIYCPKILNFAVEKGVDTMEKSVVASLPDSSSKAEAKIIFDQALTSIKEGKIEKDQLEGLMNTFRTSFEDQKIDSSEAKNLLSELKKITAPDTTAD